MGQAYLALEAYPEASSEFDVCLKRRGEATSVFLDDVPSYHHLPPVYYYQGARAKVCTAQAPPNPTRRSLPLKKKAPVTRSSRTPPSALLVQNKFLPTNYSKHLRTTVLGSKFRPV